MRKGNIEDDEIENILVLFLIDIKIVLLLSKVVIL